MCLTHPPIYRTPPAACTVGYSTISDEFPRLLSNGRVNAHVQLRPETVVWPLAVLLCTAPTRRTWRSAWTSEGDLLDLTPMRWTSRPVTRPFPQSVMFHFAISEAAPLLS